jgi:hypothetical protein
VRPRRHELVDCIAATLRASICTWPGCGAKRTSRDARLIDVPLCDEHFHETWRLAQDIADQDNIREPTATIERFGEPTRRVPRATSKTGWIYYLRVGDHIKIGYAGRLEQRLRQYPPTAVLLAAHRGTRTDEQVIHSLLTVHRAAGREWYPASAPVLAFIREAIAKHGTVPDPRTKPTGNAGQAPRRPARKIT